jgi:hypothetical protein
MLAVAAQNSAGGGLRGLAKAQASFDDPGLVWYPIIQ